MDNSIKTNLDKVYKNIEKHAKKANRDPDQIKLVAVAKNHPPKKIIKALKSDHRIFGENRVQELLDKNEIFYDQNIEWHFIGHLQKNKVKYLLKIDQLTMVESIDSIEIAKELAKEAQSYKKNINILLQINIADDPNKFGFKKSDIEEAINEISDFNNIEIKGLMTITPYNDDPNQSRHYYKELKLLFKRLNKKGYKLKELSMGMSNDYHIAVEEGATIIRVGTAIFGQRHYY